MEPTDTDSAPRILDGVRVVEFAQVMAIPFCGLLLADLGAEVIKVEPPAGDSFRHNQAQIFPGESKGFTVYNRGKRSVCLDLGRDESRSIVEKLVCSADVVLLSFKPTDIERYGLGYERMAALNPRLVYLEHVPLGPKGPYGNDGGYDVIVQGMSGLATITARATADVPQNVRPAYSDVATGYASTAGILAALLHRERTGEGQKVQTSLLSTSLTLAGNLINWFAATDPDHLAAVTEKLTELRARGAGFEEQRALYEHSMLGGGFGNIYFRHYRTKNGFISVGCLSPVLNARLRKAIAVVDPRESPGFELGTPEALDALAKLVREAEDIFRTRTSTEWLTYLHENGIPCGPLNFPNEVLSDPQVLANSFLIDLDHAALGPYKTFATPMRFSGVAAGPRASSPLLDADTDSVLGELGFSPEQIALLRASAVTGRADELNFRAI